MIIAAVVIGTVNLAIGIYLLNRLRGLRTPPKANITMKTDAPAEEFFTQLRRTIQSIGDGR